MIYRTLKDIQDIIDYDEALKENVIQNDPGWRHESRVVGAHDQYSITEKAVSNFIERMKVYLLKSSIIESKKAEYLILRKIAKQSIANKYKEIEILKINGSKFFNYHNYNEYYPIFGIPNIDPDVVIALDQHLLAEYDLEYCYPIFRDWTNVLTSLKFIDFLEAEIKKDQTYSTETRATQYDSFWGFLRNPDHKSVIEEKMKQFKYISDSGLWINTRHEIAIKDVCAAIYNLNLLTDETKNKPEFVGILKSFYKHYGYNTELTSNRKNRKKWGKYYNDIYLTLRFQTPELEDSLKEYPPLPD